VSQFLQFQEGMSIIRITTHAARKISTALKSMKMYASGI